MGQTLIKQVDEVRALLESRMRIRGRSLDAQLKKAGRRLPKSVQRDGHYLAQAALLTQNPKLARMIDETKVAKAYGNVVAHLKTLDPADRLKGQILGWLGTVSFIGIAVFVGVVWIMVERGLV